MDSVVSCFRTSVGAACIYRSDSWAKNRALSLRRRHRHVQSEIPALSTVSPTFAQRRQCTCGGRVVQRGVRVKVGPARTLQGRGRRHRRFLRSSYGMPTKAREQEAKRPTPNPRCFRVSGVFARVCRPSPNTNQSGRRVQVGFAVRFLGILRSICGPVYRDHARLRPRRNLAYAIPNACLRSQSANMRHER